MDGITSIEAKDSSTVVVKLQAPDSAFFAKVNAPYAAITNSELAEANGASAAKDADQTDKAEQWFLSNSAGSGPYVLVSYQEGDSLVLTRNDKYWGDKPAIKDVKLQQTKDAVTQRQLLEAGDVDIAMQIDPDTAKDIKSGDVTIKQVPSFNFVYIALSPSAKGNKVPLDPKVREAVRYAIDYDGMLNVTVGGAGKKQAAPIPNGFLGTKDLPLPKRDVARSRQLLKEAGREGGFEIDAMFPNVNVYGVDFNIMMQKVQSDLKEVGIDVKLQPVEFTVWVENIRGDGIPLTAVYFARPHRLHPVRTVLRDGARQFLGGPRRRGGATHQPEGS
jgi:peptide/nickel transport system substrate-binding protein